jgi:hypothetical protein
MRYQTRCTPYAMPCRHGFNLEFLDLLVGSRIPLRRLKREMSQSEVSASHGREPVSWRSP